MKQSIEDYIVRLRTATTVSEVGAMLMAELAAEGFENLVFASSLRRTLHQIIWAELPLGYATAYLENGWDRIDPVFAHLQTSWQPFAWDDVADPNLITPKQRRFFNECRELGVHSGVTVPFLLPTGRVDLISASMREPADAPPARLAFVSTLCYPAWLRSRELDPAPFKPPSRLSDREIECLKWLRAGKTNWEIGQILSISEKTVEFHVGNLMRKLGADNRVSAVMIGLQSGVLDL